MTQKKPYLTNILKLQSPITRVQRFNDNVVFITNKSFILCSPFTLNRELGGIFHVNYQHSKHIIAVCPVYVRNSYLASLFYGDGSYITQSKKTSIQKKVNTVIFQPKIDLKEKKPPDPPKPFYSIQKVTSIVKKKVFIDPKKSQKLKSSSSISKLLINDDDSPNLNNIDLKPVKTEPNSFLIKSNINKLPEQKGPITRTYIKKAHSSSSFSNRVNPSLLIASNDFDESKQIDNSSKATSKSSNLNANLKDNYPYFENANKMNKAQDGNSINDTYVEQKIRRSTNEIKIKSEDNGNSNADSVNALNTDEESQNFNENDEKEESDTEEYLDKNNSENIWLFVDSENCISAFSLTCKCNLISFKIPHVDNIIDICGINNSKCMNGQFAILTESSVLICEMPFQKENENDDDDGEESEDDMNKYIVFVYQTKVSNISPFLDGILMMRDHIIEFYNCSKVSTFYENEQLSSFFVTSRIEREREKRYQNLLKNQNEYQSENDKIIILEESEDCAILSEISSSKKLGIKKCKLIGVCDNWVASFCLGKYLIVSNINNKEQSIKIALNLSNERIRNIREIVIGYNCWNDSLTVILVFTAEIAFYNVKISILTGEDFEIEEDEYDDEEEEEAA